MCTVLCKPIKIDIDGDYPRRGSGSSVPGLNRMVDGVLPVGLGGFSLVDLMWFMLKHITAPGFDLARQHVSLKLDEVRRLKVISTEGSPDRHHHRPAAEDLPLSYRPIPSEMRG